jgi:hypothetical protein
MASAMGPQKRAVKSDLDGAPTSRPPTVAPRSAFLTRVPGASKADRTVGVGDAQDFATLVGVLGFAVLARRCILSS